MRIVWSELAEQDYREAAIYARKNREYYYSGLKLGIKQALNRLAQHPRMGAMMEDTDLRVLSLTHLPFRIIYTVEEARIVIIRLLHYARVMH